MSDKFIFSGCGSVCSNCENFKGNREPRCPGCFALKGKPFWGECVTYACMKDNGVEHCGVCGKFPCDNFIEHFDPSLGLISSVIRAGILAYRKRNSDAKAVELARKIGY